MSPDALTGPGRALQGLGRAIGGLGADLQAAADAGPSEDERYAANLELVRFQNEQDAAEAARQASFTGDAEGYTAGSVGEFDEKRTELLGRLPQHPKIQQAATLHTERMRGARYDRAFGFERTQKRGQLIAKIDETATMEVGTATPGNIPEITTKLRGVDAMIDAAPDLTAAEKSALRDKMSAQSLSRILEGVPDEDKLDVTDKLIKEWTSELTVPAAPGAPAKPPVTQPGDEPGTARDGHILMRDGTWKKIIDPPGAEGAAAPAPGAGTPGPRSDLGGPRPDKPVPYLTAKLAPGYENRTRDVEDLHPVTQDRLGAFLAAAEDAGHDIRVVSGYRSPERQRVLWNNAVKKYGSPAAARRWVAPPGGSSHQSGEAVDLQFQDRGAGLGGKRTAAVDWAHENAKKFGLNFPLSHEDWHIEPVEAREGGKRFGGKYKSGDSLYAKYAGPAGAAPDAAPKGGETQVAAGALTEGFKDFTKGRGVAPLRNPEVGILHDVSGNDPARKKVPNPENVKEYHITFDKNGVYLNVPLDRQAPHAADMNSKAIGIAHIGYEGDKLDPKAIENGARAIAFASQQTGIPVEKFLTHPEAGPNATRTTGKDPNEASWKQAVLEKARGYLASDVPGPQVAASEPAKSPENIKDRSFTAYWGVTKPGATAKETVVADAGGAVPAGGPVPEIAPPGSGPLGPADGPTPPGVIPGDGAPAAAPIKPVLRPSVRGSVVEKLLQMRPALADAKQRALGAMVERAQKSAGEGYLLPDAERAKIREKVTASGDANLLARLDAAEAAADYTTRLRQGTLEQVKGEAQRLREELNQGGGTPEQIARTKAVEELSASMAKGLADDSIGWAEKSGVLPPIEPVTPENFSVETLLARKAVADQIGQRYGMEYRQFFRNGEEKAQIEAAFTKGGDDMVNMLATMYEAFGDDTPKAVAEIAPKHPEAVRAAFLASTGGDPAAVKDVAETILRRREEGYRGAPKFEAEKVQADFKTVAGSMSGADKRVKGSFDGVFSTPPPDIQPFDRRLSDEILAAAKAIYENRVQDPATYDSDLMQQSIKAALGTRTNTAGQEFGGALSQKGTGWENPYAGGNTVLIPSNIRTDAFDAVLDAIDEKDLAAAGHPLPADNAGNPLPIARAINYGELRQVGVGKYAIWRHPTPGTKEVGGYLMTAAAPKANPDEIATGDVIASMKVGGGDLFVLDLEKLTPILRERMPSVFWKE